MRCVDSVYFGRRHGGPVLRLCDVCSAVGVWVGSMVWCDVMRNAGSLHERFVYSVMGNVVVLIKSRVIQVLNCTSKRGAWIGVLWQ